MSAAASVLNAFTTEYKKTPTKLKVRRRDCAPMARRGRPWGAAIGRRSLHRCRGGLRFGADLGADLAPPPPAQIIDLFLVYAVATVVVQVRGRRRRELGSSSMQLQEGPCG
jgi:hypothetical protein